jgi:hypothetical protein
MISSLIVLAAILSVIIVPGLILQRVENQAETKEG